MPAAVVRLFRDEDQQAISELFKSTPMKLAGFDLTYERSPHFQSLLKCQGEHFETFVAEEDGKIIGVTSLSWKKLNLQGRSVVVGYLSDLRMKRTRAAARIWREFYQEILSDNFMKSRGIDLYLTAVLAANQTAIKNLTQSKHNLFTYHLVDQQLMVNVLAKIPMSRKPVTGPVQIKNSEFSDQVLGFISECRQKKQLGFSLDEFQFRFQNWPHFQKGHSLCAEKNGEIKAICSPWSPEPVKQMKISNTQFFFKILVGLARCLGLPQLRQNQSLTTLYLTQLYFSSRISQEEKFQCLDSVLDVCLRAQDRTHLISFADEFKLSELKSFRQKYLYQYTPVNLYVVTRLGQALPEGLKPGQTIDFEMGVV